ncbi:MAG: hypothetical protein Unbinned202contig1002_5 [Prokaryotic dsDNA virus sp.]|nr:MAG: hypothetical protein Unbinned202contig1002_5 [Prokaryotic dsDNA virus sp.]|tara:strand:+ start:1118 stop:1408 length:291 start_codon:yes stop_codon:yes gene_type:complete
MRSPLTKLVQWQLRTGQLDGWTAYHIGAGAFFCKIFQWLNFSDLWCVLGVLILGIAWEVFEWIIENYEPYTTKKRWMYNTIADIIVETGIAWWMVL